MYRHKMEPTMTRRQMLFGRKIKYQCKLNNFTNIFQIDNLSCLVCPLISQFNLISHPD